jgi:hypothetical protein
MATGALQPVGTFHDLEVAIAVAVVPPTDATP